MDDAVATLVLFLINSYQYLFKLFVPNLLHCLHFNPLAVRRTPATLWHHHPEVIQANLDKMVSTPMPCPAAQCLRKQPVAWRQGRANKKELWSLSTKSRWENHIVASFDNCYELTLNFVTVEW